jgi:hypothetical protein
MRGSSQVRLAVHLVVAVAAVAAAGCGGEDDPLLEELGRCSDFDPVRRPYFGDLHVHTSMSLDANLKGTQLGMVDAYRFATGERVALPPYDANGESERSLQLDRPLDFVALTDHAEFLGLVLTCLTPGSAGYEHANCVTYRENPSAAFLALNLRLSGAQGNPLAPEPCSGDACRAPVLDAWGQVRQSAEDAYDRSPSCRFTSFVAYEWSGSPDTRNLHRNVIFRNHVVPEVPFSYFDGGYPEELWAALGRDCNDAGSPCDVLTIPHNSNLSNGLMFDQVQQDGSPFDAAYARTRAAMEPLVEVFQHKSDSECLPEQAEGEGGDPLCSFEKSPYHTLSSATLGGERTPANPRDYVRDALGQGLALGAQLGTNPFAYGMIAATDTHQSIPGAVDEATFVGHGGAGVAANDWSPDALVDLIWFNPGGLAALWAEENSREALFGAMRRREAYGTSGPRIVLRFFAGDYADDLCAQPDFAERGYAGGVPMGGTLTGTAAPAFAVWAQRDPGTAARPGVALQRVQIVKGWLDGATPRFEVFDVAGNPASGADVDLATCTPQGPGDDELCAVWRDPAYDAAVPAFYYARVLENPSCRWHTFACNAAGVDCAVPESVPETLTACCDPDFSPTIQERAWSSPIWTGAP